MLRPCWSQEHPQPLPDMPVGWMRRCVCQARPHHISPPRPHAPQTALLHALWQGIQTPPGPQEAFAHTPQPRTFRHNWASFAWVRSAHLACVAPPWCCVRTRTGFATLLPSPSGVPAFAQSIPSTTLSSSSLLSTRSIHLRLCPACPSSFPAAYICTLTLGSSRRRAAHRACVRRWYVSPLPCSAGADAHPLSEMAAWLSAVPLPAERGVTSAASGGPDSDPDLAAHWAASLGVTQSNLQGLFRQVTAEAPYGCHQSPHSYGLEQVNRFLLQLGAHVAGQLPPSSVESAYHTSPRNAACTPFSVADLSLCGMNAMTVPGFDPVLLVSAATQDSYQDVYTPPSAGGGTSPGLSPSPRRSMGLDGEFWPDRLATRTGSVCSSDPYALGPVRHVSRARETYVPVAPLQRSAPRTCDRPPHLAHASRSPLSYQGAAAEGMDLDDEGEEAAEAHPSSPSISHKRLTEDQLHPGISRLLPRPRLDPARIHPPAATQIVWADPPVALAHLSILRALLLALNCRRIKRRVSYSTPSPARTQYSLSGMAGNMRRSESDVTPATAFGNGHVHMIRTTRSTPASSTPHTAPPSRGRLYPSLPPPVRTLPPLTSTHDSAAPQPRRSSATPDRPPAPLYPRVPTAMPPLLGPRDGCVRLPSLRDILSDPDA